LLKIIIIEIFWKLYIWQIEINDIYFFNTRINYLNFINIIVIIYWKNKHKIYIVLNNNNNSIIIIVKILDITKLKNIY